MPRLVILVAVALMGFAFALSTVDAAGPVLYRVVDETERNPLGSSIALRVSGTNELTNPVLIGRGDRALTRIASGRWSLNEPMRLIVESPYPGDGTLETELDLRVAGASFLNDGWNVVVELVVTDTAIEIRVSQPRTRGLLLDRTSAFSTMVRRARVTGSRSSSDPAHSDSTPTTVHGTIDPSGPPSVGSISLNAGFPRDPRTFVVQAGGLADTSSLPSYCPLVSMSELPHLRLNYTAGNFGLAISAYSAESDLVLVVQRPDGAFVCDDDTSGLNPAVQFTSPPSGNYNIWVGVYESGFASGTLAISELGAYFP